MRSLAPPLIAFLAVASLVAPSLLAAPLAGPRDRVRKNRAPDAPPVEVAQAPWAWPGGDRAALELPEEAWARVRATGGLSAHPIGYSADEMRNYGRDAHLMRTVETLFRDARTIPRFAGRVTDEMLATAATPSLAELVRQSYVLTDIAAARMFPAPSRESWNLEGVEAGASPRAALARALALAAPEDRPRAGLPAAERAALASLPEPAARFVARIIAGAIAAQPWLALGRESAAIRPSTDRPDARRAALYRLASAPWKDEAHDQVATLSKASFDLLRDIDRAYAAHGAVIFLHHADLALAELRESAAKAGGVVTEPAGASVRAEFETRFGRVRVTGTGADANSGAAFLHLDLGGDDAWTGAHAASAGAALPISVAVDVAGNDAWTSEEAAALGCGLFGVGLLVDLSGNDTYRVRESGLGAGWFGTGVLADLAGTDRYEVMGAWGQGVGHAGVGLLLDSSGDDEYTCAEQSQGMGSTLGAGVLVDLTGDDRYVARDDGNVSALYLNQSVAMAQGCGYGRRADIGDGHSLAGGFGILLDGAGDDLYHAQVWAQGAAYWWSVGILEDRGGNDRYENGKYSAGAAAHFGIGCFVDLAGNDRYNEGVATAVNQHHGHARDGSIGIAVDGDGDDTYFFRSHCGGSADLGSIGLLWDRRGDDRYEVTMPEPGDAPAQDGWTGTPPMGSATWYPPHRSWRDELPAIGVFLDTGGRDTHGAASPGREGGTWTRHPAPLSFGVGMDVEWYPPSSAAPATAPTPGGSGGR